MSDLEFLSFLPTPQDEKQIGVAVIRLEKRFIFRFKITPNEKGGFYIQPASCKTVCAAQGAKDKYAPGFQFESSYEADEIKDFVESNVQARLSQNSSVFTPQPQQNFNQAYQPQNQNHQNQPYFQQSQQNLPYPQTQPQYHQQAPLQQQQSMFGDDNPPF